MARKLFPAPLEGISEYCAHTLAQLLIIAPATTAQLLRYFDQCYTQTQAYHTQIPVLVLRATESAVPEACCEHCQQRLTQEETAARLVAYRAMAWA